MDANQQLIQKFYACFQNLDHEGMVSCYHEDIRFSDPVFPFLKGKEASAMWQMLIDTLKKDKENWKLELREAAAEELEGSCRWEAHYIFSLTQRKVHNIVHARFKFKDGKIIQHDDFFNFYRWAKMAFGFTGFALGWTQFFRQRLQSRVNERLKAFMNRSNTM